jgi:hypothetical protein
LIAAASTSNGDPQKRDGFLSRLTSRATGAVVDINELLDRVDVNDLMERVDINELLSRVDVYELMDRPQRAHQNPGLPVLILGPRPRVPGHLLGAGIGIVLGWSVVRALADERLGAFRIPFGQVLLALVLAAVAGVLAAIWPARKASRMNILDATTSE